MGCRPRPRPPRSPRCPVPARGRRSTAQQRERPPPPPRTPRHGGAPEAPQPPAAALHPPTPAQGAQPLCTAAARQPPPRQSPRQSQVPGALPRGGQVTKGKPCPPPFGGANANDEGPRWRNRARGHLTQQQPPIDISTYPKTLVAPGIFPCPLLHVHILVLPFYHSAPPPPALRAPTFSLELGAVPHLGHRPVCTWKGEELVQEETPAGPRHSPPHPSPPLLTLQRHKP